jgi:hypothetical protein
MTSQAASLKTAARNTNLPKTNQFGTTNYRVRTEAKRFTYKGQVITEFGNATLYVNGYYDIDFATQIARDLIAQTSCRVSLIVNKHGQVSITATTGCPEITLVNPYAPTADGFPTFTDIATA